MGWIATHPTVRHRAAACATAGWGAGRGSPPTLAPAPRSLAARRTRGSPSREPQGEAAVNEISDQQADHSGQSQGAGDFPPEQGQRADVEESVREFLG